ncbi:hypothetical protein GOBAR_DD27675 [Gossypium barbadense]|nr:hypothetical protein GOBAR_DD27675 [Gossypium barbadense]
MVEYHSRQSFGYIIIILKHEGKLWPRNMNKIICEWVQMGPRNDVAEGSRKNDEEKEGLKSANDDVEGEEKKTEEDYEQIDGKSRKLMVHGVISKTRTAKKMNQTKGKEVQRWSDESKSDEARIEDTIPPANPPQDQIWTRELKELMAELKSDMMQLKASLKDIAQSLCQVQAAIRNSRS